MEQADEGKCPEEEAAVFERVPGGRGALFTDAKAADAEPSAAGRRLYSFLGSGKDVYVMTAFG
jgi:hypothetical protein